MANKEQRKKFKEEYYSKPLDKRLPCRYCKKEVIKGDFEVTYSHLKGR